MQKIKIPNNIFINPMPVVIIGSKSTQKDNFMTCAWITRVNAAPPIIAISLNKNHHTSPAIRENGYFSINIPTEELLEKTDYCGMVSERKTIKSSLFDVFYTEDLKVPMIKECAVNIECKLIDIKDLPSNTVFFGEIINSYSNEKYMKDNMLDNTKVDSFSIIMPENIYISKGKKLGNAWDENTMKKFTGKH